MSIGIQATGKESRVTLDPMDILANVSVQLAKEQLPNASADIVKSTAEVILVELYANFRSLFAVNEKRKGNVETSSPKSNVA